MVISRGPLDPNEPPMVEVRKFHQSREEKTTKEPLVGETQDGGDVHGAKGPLSSFMILSSGKAVVSKSTQPMASPFAPEKIDRAVEISPDLNMATNVRSYKEWPGKYAVTSTT